MQLKLHLQIVSTHAFNIARQDIQLWVENALTYAPELIAHAELTLRLVDEVEMTQLNGQFRGKPKPTNVLSFPTDAAGKFTQHYIGDVVICWPVVIKEANNQNKALSAHLAHLTIHGVLHCLGYDHVEPAAAKRMEAIEIKLLNCFNIDNPYEVISND